MHPGLQGKPGWTMHAKWASKPMYDKEKVDKHWMPCRETPKTRRKQREDQHTLNYDNLPIIFPAVQCGLAKNEMR